MCWGLGQSAASRIFHRPGERDGAKGLVIVAEKWPWYTTLSWGGWSSEYPFSWRLYGEMYTIWQNCVKPQHICPYTSTPTFNIQPSPLNRTSVQAPICASTPPRPSLRCRWVCFVDPSVTAVSEGRLVEWCRGEEGCLAEPLPLEGGQWKINKTKIQSCRSQQELSTVGGQLSLNVHSADGAFPAGGQPLVHTRLVEEMHAG